MLTGTNVRTISVCNNPNVTVQYQGGTEGTYKKMTDYPVPGFRRRSLLGEVFNNPCDAVKVLQSYEMTGYQHSLVSPGCTYGTSHAWKDHNQSLLHRVYGPILWTAALAQHRFDSAVDLESQAATQALSRVKAPEVQGMAFIGEIRETLKTLRNPIKALTDLTRKYSKAIKAEKIAERRRQVNLRKRRKRRASDASREAAFRLTKDVNSASTELERGLLLAQGAGNQYLAWLYGVRPLMQDIEGTLEALHNDRNSIFVPVRQTARGRVIETDETTSDVVTTIGDPLTSITVRTVVKRERTVRAGFLYAHQPELVKDALGLNLAQIPAALWELTPWSFVADWAFNVGEVISALTAAVTTPSLAEWISTKTEIDVKREVISTTLNSHGGLWAVDIPCSDKDSCVIETYTRRPARLWTNVSLRASFPLNANNGLAALSLFIQQL